MKHARIIIAVAMCTTFSAGIALASWYDDYDAGVNAARKGQWQIAFQKMNAAIAGNSKEGDKTRTYGAIFINYHPYYYRGVANLQLGHYEQAITDFERTSGPGEENLGSIGELIQRAKTKLADASTPPPAVTETRPVVTQPVVPPPPTNTQPVAPSIDNALRNRARTALDQARAALTAAQQRNAAGTPEYKSALEQYKAANSRWASAKSNDELLQIAADADNIALSVGSAQVATITKVPPPVTPTDTSKIGGARGIVLGPIQADLQQALRDYFDGEFESAERGFSSLTRQLPNNAWIWAFLGASQYSQYAFEGEVRDKDNAMRSFKTAKKLRRWNDGLPAKYFSRRIRNAFKENA